MGETIQHQKPETMSGRAKMHALEMLDDAGELVGHATFEYLSKPFRFYHIGWLEVNKERRGEGKGGELLKAIHAFLEQRGAAGLLKEGISDYSPASGMYERSGWRQVPSMTEWFSYNVPKHVSEEMLREAARVAMVHEEKRNRIQLDDRVEEVSDVHDTDDSSERGVTLIDTVVGISLMLVVFMGINSVFRLSVDVVTNNKARAGAIALADQRMEYMRSIAYLSVGTVGGIPSGAVPQSETVALNGITYTRRTIVVYADDPKDGLGAADNFPAPPTGPITADYKAVKVDVAWTTRYGGTRHVDLVTRVSPPTSAGETNPCSGPCGTLLVSVFNKASQPLAGASVTITNPTTNPTINFGTFTNASGTVTVLGAPQASGYHVVVTNTGYSTDQTYDAVSPNTYPSPGNLSVSNNQTTSPSFYIDVLGTKNIRTWTQILSGTWTEFFTDTTKIATSTNISVASGAAKLSGSSGSYPTYGEFQSIAIGPSALATWQKFTVATTTPSGTGTLFRFYDGGGTTLIPDSQLPGNAAGFATTSVNLSLVSTSTYPAIRVDATLTSNNPAVTPSVLPYSITYTYGPQLLPNIAFGLHGNKIIGADSSHNNIYKYNQTLNTGTYSVAVIPNFEYDNYTISVNASTGYDLASACHAQGEYITGAPAQFAFAPGAQTTSDVTLASHTVNSLPVEVVSNADGSLISGASVRLYATGYDTTQTTNSCGQTFFSGLTSGAYSVSVSKTGYTTNNGSVNVSGTTLPFLVNL